MANSRELVECVAELTLEKPMRVSSFMRELREAGKKLVTTGGRGIVAPRMKATDAASLLCAMFAARSVQESAQRLLDLKSLPAAYQGRRARTRHDYEDVVYEPAIALQLLPGHSVVDGLGAAIGFFMREDEVFDPHSQFVKDNRRAVYARFEVHSPQSYASLTVGIHGRYSDIWTYGRKGDLDAVTIRRCSEVTLRKIARCLSAS